MAKEGFAVEANANKRKESGIASFAKRIMTTSQIIAQIRRDLSYIGGEKTKTKS